MKTSNEAFEILCARERNDRTESFESTDVAPKNNDRDSYTHSQQTKQRTFGIIHQQLAAVHAPKNPV